MTCWVVRLTLTLLVVGSIGFARGDQLPGGSTNPNTHFEFSFDEYGNGSISVNGGPFVSNPGFKGTDLAFGFTDVLIYPLPAPVVPGYVLVHGSLDELGGVGSPSDGINFFNDGTNHGFMAYYSEIGGEPDPLGNGLADVGVPLRDPHIDIFEVGPEDSNGFDYVLAGDNAYHGVSDGIIPEPTALSLAGLAIVSLLGYAGWRRRQKLVAA